MFDNVYHTLAPIVKEIN